MIAAEVIDSVRAAGLKIEALPDGRLRVTPRERLTAGLRAALAAYRAEVLALLPLSGPQALVIRSWLAAIGECDPTVVADVLDRCAADADCRAYFLARAADRGAPRHEMVGRTVAGVQVVVEHRL